MNPGVVLWRLQTWQLFCLSKEGAGEANDGWLCVRWGARRCQQGGEVEGVNVQGEKLAA